MVDMHWVLFGLSCVLFLCFVGFATWSMVMANRLGVARADLKPDDFAMIDEYGHAVFLDQKAADFLLKLPQLLRFVSCFGVIGALLSACGAAVQVMSFLA